VARAAQEDIYRNITDLYNLLDEGLDDDYVNDDNNMNID
jgi:hypothetical protein